ncbi:MAG: V-type ATP synthase subunit D [Spirochaetales bacterium]|nr:V-type ATP synthase subunit D [Spirochaetales bacterium]
MAAIKLTKNELKKQKDSLKRFQRYLPTLVLKKQQLQMVIRQVETQLSETRKERDAKDADFQRWIEVFGEDIWPEDLIRVDTLEQETGNIAGLDIPVFKNMTFIEGDYSLFETPLWIDSGLIFIRALAVLDAQMEILQKQIELLSEELRITNQRVNLFEKVKIPEARENIRKIRIYLGDQQTASVVRGKIAKNKVAREA